MVYLQAVPSTHVASVHYGCGFSHIYTIIFYFFANLKKIVIPAKAGLRSAAKRTGAIQCEVKLGWGINKQNNLGAKVKLRDDKRKKLTKALGIKIFKSETNITFLFIFGFYMFLIYDKITGKRE